MDSLKFAKDTAAEWIARRGDEAWGSADEAELEHWLNASTGNRIAYMRLEAAWKESDRLKVLGAGFPRGAVPTLEDFRASPFFKHIAKDAVTAPARAAGKRNVFLRWGIAASILVIIAATFAGWPFFSDTTAYSTPIGVTAAVPLPDGSKITLNTDSEIRVAVTERERRVELAHGEAFFEVTRDPARPFTVEAGDKRIVVLGTKFSVKRERGDVQVVVTEGQVRVDDTVLSAGNVASAKGGKLAVQERTAPQAEELLSWRSGYVVFHETSLVDAAAEFNRYNTRKFVLKDPALAAIHISGNFRSTNIDSFLRLLEDGFPVIVERQDERIVLRKRP